MFNCQLPFNHIKIYRNGDVYVCEKNLTPSIGNVLSDSLENIWKGHIANSIRNRIKDQSFSSCNLKKCFIFENKQACQQFPNLLSDSFTENQKPKYVRFHVDSSCILQCAGCRPSVIYEKNEDEINNMCNVINRTLNYLFSEPHNDRKILLLDNVGEFITSPVWNRVFKNEKIFTDPHLWPNTRFQLFTSGVHMTSEWQEDNAHILKQTNLISISVRAGSKEVYEKIRGPYWNVLWNNIKYLSEKFPSIKVVWSLIVDITTYETIPNLIDIANTFDNKPYIQFGSLKDWGTFTPIEIQQLDITSSSSSMYEKYLAILNLEKVKTYPT